MFSTRDERQNVAGGKALDLNISGTRLISIMAARIAEEMSVSLSSFVDNMNLKDVYTAEGSMEFKEEDVGEEEEEEGESGKDLSLDTIITRIAPTM